MKRMMKNIEGRIILNLDLHGGVIIWKMDIKSSVKGHKLM